MTSGPIPVVGAGLAGSEAAWQIAEAGLGVRLHDRAVGVLQAELHALDSLLLRVAARVAERVTERQTARSAAELARHLHNHPIPQPVPTPA